MLSMKVRKDPFLLDVRPFLASGQDPFLEIMNAKENLSDGQELHLIAPFKPIPLMHIFESEGYRVETSVPREGEWHVRLIPGKQNDSKVLELDLRDLEPPEPLHKALLAATALGRDETLILHTRFRPVHLFEELSQNQYDWECDQSGPGHWITHVWRLVT